MTDHQIRKATDTYFDILTTEGIPEQYVASSVYEDGQLTVTILTGKRYSKGVKQKYVETSRDVRGWVVPGITGPSTEPVVQRDWHQATQSVESRGGDNAEVL